MIVYLIGMNNIYSLKLPLNFKGNYWLKYIDENGNNVNLVNILGDNDQYIAKSNGEVKIEYNGKYLPQVSLTYDVFYTLKYGKEVMYMYVISLYDRSFSTFSTTYDEINIGKKSSNDIIYNHPFVADYQARIIKMDYGLEIRSSDENIGMYVNKERCNVKLLKIGDSIFIGGLRIIYVGKFWLINNPNSLVSLSSKFNVYDLKVTECSNKESDPSLKLYGESDYFEKSPRLITEFKRQKVIIDTPPEKAPNEDTPLILTIGPMLTMSLTSVVTIWQVIDRMNSGATLAQSLPSLIMAFAMLLTLILWPIISSMYQKKRTREKEEERKSKYRKYLLRKINEINNHMVNEKRILIENIVPLEECQDIIVYKKRNLWEREIAQKDFLSVKIGMGSIKPDIDINYPEDHFSLSDDELRAEYNRLTDKDIYIKEAPINISLIEKRYCAIIGNDELTSEFIESLLIQIMTFHSYRDLKIVLLKSDCDDKMSYLKNLPHIFSDDMQVRFYGNNIEDCIRVSEYLTSVFNSRRYNIDGNLREGDYKDFGTYYLIIADNNWKIKNLDIVTKLLECPVNCGFSILFRSRNLSSLPKECNAFITIGGEDGKISGYFENELVSEKQQQFAADLNIKNRVDITNCIESLAKIPLRLSNVSKKLPTNVSFLEMYDVGSVEQLNALYRWEHSNPMLSLDVPIGVGVNGDLFRLDLHEKRHGPHGLIAGMTGSGKSEFIITFILSMAINYHPYEVSFVLIDYKGGGLTGAFENKNTGLVLPHLAGTITNLDDSTMNRSLASIRAELERRQRLFKEARESLGESTIDIYKYQRFYREGKVSKPVSHLFIISDEFAELKQQKPEFMQELISTARIGRSLGVHLILATQRPSGIVDDQIWSNSKFKICLKVQDKIDSNDVIGRPDAALLSDVGRFFLQVGYNEYFAIGQSAYSGGPYFPEEKRSSKIDMSINFIDNIGNKVRNIDNEVVNLKADGEEVSNIVKYLVKIADENNIHIDNLWLDKLKDIIYLNDLIDKYGYKAEFGVICPIVGEMDDPDNQRQELLTIPLSTGGNVVLYGMAGSGKEDFLTTMIYSIITCHSVSEVNIYILDFGSGYMKVFAEAPQVGDVITSLENEKVDNFFKFIASKIEERKQLLSDYNGDFNFYNSKSEEKLPLVVILINNYEAFIELYEDNHEIFVSLSRDCIRYGIVFVISASSTNSVRFRVSQNFSQLIPLQLSDRIDYRTLLGKTGVFPSPVIGRGLIKLEDIYEFQTALVYDRDNQRDYIVDVCSKLNKEAQDRAVSIPVLPKKVSFEYLKNYLKDYLIPVGIYKENLGIACINIKNNYVSLVSSVDIDLFTSFVNPLVRLLKCNYNVMVIDCMENIKNKDDIIYYDSNYEDSLSKLEDHLNSNEQMAVVITGFADYISKVDKEKLTNLFIKGSETKNIYFVIVDTDIQYKKFEYEDWYRKCVNTSQGVWIGNGINEQMSIKINKNVSEGKKEIPNNFGFVIDKGVARYVKLLEDDLDEQ